MANEQCNHSRESHDHGSCKDCEIDRLATRVTELERALKESDRIRSELCSALERQPLEPFAGP